MLKVQVRRVVRSKSHLHDRIDDGFVNAAVHTFPEVGEQIQFYFDRLGYGVWCTTPVVRISQTKDGTKIRTRNSVYHLKMGWKETDQ
jgi:hypothetical protein